MLTNMLKNEKVISIIISLVCGFSGTYLVYSNARTDTAILEKKTKIAVATSNIEAGDSIYSFVKFVEYPEAFAPVKAVQSRQKNELKKLTAAVPIPKGQPILWNCTSLPLYERGLAARLNNGERAFSLKIGEEDGISGVLRAGHYVDILATYAIPGTGGRITRTLLQNMPVLSFSRLNGVASFRVTPQEAELLAFASEAARLRFTLRGAGDRSLPPETPGVDFANLKAVEKEAVEKKSKRKSEEKPRIVYD